MRSAYGLDSQTDVDWRQRATCNPTTADMWDMTPGGFSMLNHAALTVCRTVCPVRAECDAWEQAHPSPWPRIAGGRVWRTARSGAKGNGAPAANAVDATGLDGAP